MPQASAADIKIILCRLDMDCKPTRSSIAEVVVGKVDAKSEPLDLCDNDYTANNHNYDSHGSFACKDYLRYEDNELRGSTIESEAVHSMYNVHLGCFGTFGSCSDKASVITAGHLPRWHCSFTRI